MATAQRELTIASRKIGDAYAPFVIPEIGINHEGDMAKARRMIDDAAAGCAVGCDDDTDIVEMSGTTDDG
jgi:N-acetylneuraminate synthase